MPTIDITLGMQIIAILTTIIVVFLLSLIFFKDKLRENKLKNRLYSDDFGKSESLIQKMKEKEKEKGFMENLDKELKQARMDMTSQLFMVMSIVLALVITVIGLSIFTSGLFFPFFMFIGFLIPRLYLKGRREKFIEKFDTDMVKALRRIAAVLRVGGSLDQALNDVITARSIPDIVKYEFSKVYVSYKAGFPIEESFYGLYESVGSRDTLYLCVAIDIQMETGGNLEEIIDGIAGTITAKNLKLKNVKSKLAEIDISIKMMALMPIVFGFLITLLNPDHFMFFTQDLMGQLIGLVLVSFIIGGYYIIKRLSKIDI